MSHLDNFYTSVDFFRPLQTSLDLYGMSHLNNLKTSMACLTWTNFIPLYTSLDGPL